MKLDVEQERHIFIWGTVTAFANTQKLKLCPFSQQIDIILL